MNIAKITMNDLKERLGKSASDELILDVRSPEEYQQGHVPGSRNIPHDQVSQYADQLNVIGAFTCIATPVGVRERPLKHCSA